MKAIALIICLLLCADFAEAKTRHRRRSKPGRKATAAKRRHSPPVARPAPCPVRVLSPTCPDVVKVMTADEVDAESNIDLAFQRQFVQWLAQHPEANQSPEMAVVVREISMRWYRRGREDGKKK